MPMFRERCCLAPHVRLSRCLRPWMGAAAGNHGGRRDRARAFGTDRRQSWGVLSDFLPALPSGHRGVLTEQNARDTPRKNLFHMYMRKHFGIALIGLTLLGAGCAGKSLPLAKGEPEGVNQSAIVTYTESTTGLTFDYPSAWGEIRVSREVKSIDTGKRVSIGFSKAPRVSLVAVSADYSEGIGEGTPNYFTFKEGANLSTTTTVASALKQSFAIVSMERVEDGVYRMTHNATTYGEDTPRAISYLFTKWSAPGFTTLMATAPDRSNVLPEFEALVQSIR